MNFNLRDKLRFPLLFAVGCGAILGLPLFHRAGVGLATVATLLTLVGGLTGFFYAQHFQALQIFRDLFREFNSRYDILNERLNEIYDRPVDEPLKREKTANNKSDIDVLYDYFNLCAEEHMYAAAGYIDPRVWIAWQTGMAYFAADPEILALWEHELHTQQKSYYGFSLDNIRNS
jgi:hypothetical protein